MTMTRGNNMEDLRQYSDAELSLLIFNTESLYRNRHRLTKDTLKEMFRFREAQWREFRKDLKDKE